MRPTSTLRARVVGERPAWWVASVVIAVAGILAGCGPASRTWDELRAVADGLPMPDGVTVVDRREIGTTQCVITCDEARVEIHAPGPATPHEELCADFDAVLRPVLPGLSTEMPWGLVGCLFAPLPSISDVAYFQLMPLPCPEGVDGLCARLVVNSGVD